MARSTWERRHSRTGEGDATRVARLIAVLELGCVACGCAGGSGPATTASTRQSVSGRPQLLLSSHRGRAGKRIAVKGVNCPRPRSQRDELTWHDSYEAAHPGLERFRRIEPLHRSGTTVRARFRILKSDTAGRGILVLFCGGRGNAVGYVTVVR